MSKVARSGRLSLALKQVRLHDDAVEAYDAYSALPQMLDLSKIPAPVIASLLARSTLVVVDTDQAGDDLHVIGGFDAYQLLSAYKCAGRALPHVNAVWVLDDPPSRRAAVQAELLLALRNFPSRTSGRAVTRMIKLLENEYAEILLGADRVTRQNLSKTTKLHARDLVHAKRGFRSSSRSVLDQLLSGDES